MTKVAVLVDLGFFLPRYRTVMEQDADARHSPKEVAKAVFKTAVRHVEREHGEELYRILVYDCKPLGKKAHNPITGRSIDFSKTPLYHFRNELHRELVCLRKVALRLGELMDDTRWVIKPEPLQRLLRKQLTVEDLTDEDLRYDVSQKGVDIKFGIDIASLAYKRLVDRIVLITGDSDFVPAAKLARREGLDVVLDPLWNHVAPSLHEHIDGLRSVWPKNGPKDSTKDSEAMTDIHGAASPNGENTSQSRRNGKKQPWQRFRGRRPRFVPEKP